MLVLMYADWFLVQYKDSYQVEAHIILLELKCWLVLVLARKHLCYICISSILKSSKKLTDMFRTALSLVRNDERFQIFSFAQSRVIIWHTII